MEGYSLASIGDLYKDLEAYHEAMEAYAEAMEIAQSIEDQYLVLYLRLAETRIRILQKQMKQATALLDLAFNPRAQFGLSTGNPTMQDRKSDPVIFLCDLSTAGNLFNELHAFFPKLSGQPDSQATNHAVSGDHFRQIEEFQKICRVVPTP